RGRHTRFARLGVDERARLDVAARADAAAESSWSGVNARHGRHPDTTPRPVRSASSRRLLKGVETSARVFTPARARASKRDRWAAGRGGMHMKVQSSRQSYRFLQGAAVLLLAVTACDRSRVPSAPQPVPTPTPTPIAMRYRVSGVVADEAGSPIANARIEIDYAPPSAQLFAFVQSTASVRAFTRPISRPMGRLPLSSSSST